MSYCMLVGPEQSFSVLNVYPMSVLRYGLLPIQMKRLVEDLFTYLVTCLFR